MSRPTSFYYAFLVLPRAQREAVIAVWDFCRAVDDTVDEAQAADTDRESVRRRLDAWREEIERCYAGRAETPQGRALQPWIGACRLTRQPFEDLVDGVEMDLDCSRYETFDALYEYCWRVASTVGYICIEIFDVRDEAAREYAHTLGVALQLTNILRDVGGDLEGGRLYLPQEDLARFGCTEDLLRGGIVTGPVRDLLAFEASRAHEFYARARTALQATDRRRLVAAEIMGAIYLALLARIERGGFDVLGGRTRVPRPRQAVVALSAWLRNRMGLDVPA